MGGGGGFVEVLMYVEPYDVLEVVVGSGGGGGANGTCFCGVYVIM